MLTAIILLVVLWTIIDSFITLRWIHKEQQKKWKSIVRTTGNYLSLLITFSNFLIF